MQDDDDQRPGKLPARAPLPGDPRPHANPGYAQVLSLAFVLLATVGLLFARLPLLADRPFDPDEFEHAHAAWCVSKGMLPYRDFFEHHTPWYHYALSPFFHGFNVDVSFASAKHFLLFGRGLSLALTILSVFLVAGIGRLWHSRRVGLVAGLFLVGQPFFLQKTIEMRPDVLALPFFLGSLWFLLRGLAASAEGDRRSLGHFLGAGLSLGAAIMCTQKMLFVLPGALAGLGSWALFVGPVGRRVGMTRAPLSHLTLHHRRRTRLRLILAFLLGACVPAALTWAAFALHHAGGEFIANNFLLNATWKHIESDYLRKLVETSRPVLALSLLGAAACLYRWLRSPHRPPEGVLLFCTVVGLFAGLLVVPVARRQYYLMPLPIVCLFGAQGLSILIERVRETARPWLVMLAAIPFVVLPALDLRATYTLHNDRQLARLRYVFETTRPTDVVLDGWEGMGVFRPHALHHFFLHSEFVDRLPREQVDAYLNALESGRIRPRLIAMDENLVALGPRFLRFVKSNYVRRDMPGQDQRKSADWPKFFKKLLKRNDASWDGAFYFAKDGLD